MSKVTYKPKLKAKRWNPKIEEEIINQWTENGTYNFDPKKEGKIFSLDTPPPYISGRWHVGSATHYSQIDMIARTKRMSGYNVNFPMAIDRNGLPIEVEVEKKYNIAMWEVPREKFLGLCREYLDKNEASVINICKRLGLSCNSFEFEAITRTDSPDYRSRTQATFIELWNRGLIYEASRPNNWCPVCRTTIADAEVEYREATTQLSTITFKVKETGEDLPIATTRPELLCACGIVLVHPEDSRYKHIQEKTAIIPIFDLEVPIIAHPQAKMDFGTGAMMVCSYGDYSDVRLFRDLNLKPINAINPDGRMTKKAGKYEGLTVDEAREQILADLKSKGLLSDQTTTTQRTPTCWRSHNPVEFIAMPEYYLKQLDYVDALKEVINKIKFYPPKNKQILIDWLNSITTDWPISRRRYYGTEVPLWYCKKCKKPIVPEPGEYYQPWKDPIPFDKCPSCGTSKDIRGETRTLDTWMDSSISPLVAIGYLRDDELFKKAFPCSLRPQGKDIVRTWLNYTLLRVYQLFKKPGFEHVWISGMVLDDKGKAMHKSVGNVIWPEPLLEKYGADTFRLLGCLEAQLGSDVRFSLTRLAGVHKFLTKLWNIARFISMFPKPQGKFQPEPLDEWILGELNQIIEHSIKGYENLNFHVPARLIRNFLWETFASHYIELVKTRAYNHDNKYTTDQQQAAWHTLHGCLKVMLKLLAPICPFVTEKLYQDLYDSKNSIHLELFPKPQKHWKTELTSITPIIFEVNSSLWKIKKDNNLALRDPLELVYLPSELETFHSDLQLAHHIKNLKFGRTRDKNMLNIKKPLSEVYVRIK